MLKPTRLQPGDTVAVLSPSWGGPSVFPNVFDLGLRNIEEIFRLRIKEYPTARMDDSVVYANPKARAEDINRAFADPEVKAIVASIGGDDSVRILPFLDRDTILANPKILMGFSDTATLTCYLNSLGLVTFNGPAVMAGFAQMRHLPTAFAEHVRNVLFHGEAVEYMPYESWINKYLPWETPGYDGEVEEPRPHDGWRWLQGNGVALGKLFGGCIEVVDFLRGTRFWPSEHFWEGRVLFFETSEDQPPVSQVKYWIRNYGSMGVLDQVNGILFGRSRSYSDEQKEELYETLVRVVASEFGRPDLPIVANLDFGHTDPQWVMPLGITAEIDCVNKRLRLTESAVS